MPESTVPHGSELGATERPAKSCADRLESADLDGLDGWAHDQGRGADEHQEVGHRKALRDREDGQDCGMCDPGSLYHLRWVSLLEAVVMKVLIV